MVRSFSYADHRIPVAEDQAMENNYLVSDFYHTRSSYSPIMLNVSLPADLGRVYPSHQRH